MTTIQQILNKEIESAKSPSVQYYLFNESKILEYHHAGFSNIAKQQKTDSDTTYHAYSITKTFTALAILQLAEEEKININHPVIQYLLSIEYGKEITVKQLLNHTAGIPNPIPIAWIHLETEHKTFDRNVFFNRVLNKNNKVKSKPGEKFAYSNLGYIILGQLIEQVSGKSYEDYISDNIIQKLLIGDNELSFSIRAETHATGYQKRTSFANFLLGFFIDKSKFMGKPEGKWRPFKNFYVNGTAYGGLIGKPSAFVKYIQELLKDNCSLISSQSKKLLFQENKNTGMCLSWFTGELNGIQYFTHAGGGGGYYCEIRLYPEVKMGSVIFFNRTGMTDERFLDKVDKFYINVVN